MVTYVHTYLVGLQVDIRIVSQLCVRTSVVLCCRVWFVVVVVAVAAAVAVAAVAAVAAAVVFAVVVAVALVWSGLAGTLWRASVWGY